MLFGSIFVLTGILFQFLGKVPGIGHLPGDIIIKRENITFYFPWVTCLVVSLVLSVIFSLFLRR